MLSENMKLKTEILELGVHVLILMKTEISELYLLCSKFDENRNLELHVHVHMTCDYLEVPGIEDLTLMNKSLQGIEGIENLCHYGS